MSTHLHYYQCSFCRYAATASTHMPGDMLPCVFCRRYMAYQWSEPITTDEQRERAAKGIVYTQPWEVSSKPYTKKPCDACRQHVEPEQMVKLSGVGRFCSEDCAQVGVLKHQAVMQRLEQLYERKPWIRPAPKEQKAS